MASPIDMYAAAFAGAEADRAFLDYYEVGADKQLLHHAFTRQEFWDLSRKAAAVLLRHGIKPGDHVVHLFSENSAADLAFRLAGTMVGAVPVTVNWSADTQERVEYKIDLTRARLVLVDQQWKQRKPDWVENVLDGRKVDEESGVTCRIFYTSSLAESEDEPLPEDQFCRQMDGASTRIVIFTSGGQKAT